MKFILQPWQLMLIILASWVNRQQQEVIEYLRAENAVLKETLGKKRILLTDEQRRRLAVKGKLIGRKQLEQVGTLFTPDTILRWHRQLVANKWDYSDRKEKRPGRSRIRQVVVDLTVKFAKENPTWGYDRISGALSNVGYNFGLHDLKRVKSPEPLNTIDDYQRNLREFVRKAKANPNTKEASLLFALTTPYPAGVTPVRLPDDAVKYNTAAVEVMRNEKVPIVDLYLPVADELETLQKPQNVHFNKEGSRTLALIVAEAILKQLKLRGEVAKDVSLSPVAATVERPTIR